MRKEVLLFLISILLINLVSAGYTCSGTPSAEEDVIEIGQINSINHIGIALLDSGSRGTAEMLIDAKELRLTSEANFTNVTLSGIYHEINLTSISSSVAIIKVDAVEGTLEQGKTTAVGDLQIYVSEINGIYPGEGASTKFFAGKDYLFLYASNPQAVRNVSDIGYLFEVSSSDSSGAIIKVTKCEGSNFVWSDETEQEPEDEDVEGSPPQDEPSNEPENEDIEDTLPDVNEEVEEKTFLQENFYILVISLIIIIIIVVSLVLVFKYRAYRKSQGALPENQKE